MNDRWREIIWVACKPTPTIGSKRCVTDAPPGTARTAAKGPKQMFMMLKLSTRYQN